jgi:hypothetical protein
MTRTWTVLLGAVAISAMALTGCSNVAGPYDTCGDSSDCTSAVDGCSFLSSATRTVGICTNNCTSNADCPTDSRGFSGSCLSLSGTEAFICFETCLDDFDCPGALRCTPTVGSSGEAICLPQ